MAAGSPRRCRRSSSRWHAAPRGRDERLSSGSQASRRPARARCIGTEGIGTFAIVAVVDGRSLLPRSRDDAWHHGPHGSEPTGDSTGVDTDGHDRGWHQDDTIDVMILIDRSEIGRPLTDEWPPADLLDHYVIELHKRLQVLENRATLVVESDELPDEEGYPNNIYGVVTNVPSAARWTRSWGGTLVELKRRGDSLMLIGRDTRTFDRAHLNDALEFTSSELDALPDRPPDVGVTPTERRMLEVVLRDATRAVDEVALNPEDRALLQAAVDTLRAQLASPEPDRHIVGRVLRRLLRSAEGS